jgi:hypothetical protein
MREIKHTLLQVTFPIDGFTAQPQKDLLQKGSPFLDRLDYLIARAAGEKVELWHPETGGLVNEVRLKITYQIKNPLPALSTGQDTFDVILLPSGKGVLENFKRIIEQSGRNHGPEDFELSAETYSPMRLVVTPRLLRKKDKLSGILTEVLLEAFTQCRIPSPGIFLKFISPQNGLIEEIPIYAAAGSDFTLVYPHLKEEVINQIVLRMKECIPKLSYLLMDVSYMDADMPSKWMNTDKDSLINCLKMLVPAYVFAAPVNLQTNFEPGAEDVRTVQIEVEARPEGVNRTIAREKITYIVREDITQQIPAGLQPFISRVFASGEQDLELRVRAVSESGGDEAGIAVL